jgi:response regulator RpfG family c-di-GMP phosphodiesterase
MTATRKPKVLCIDDDPAITVALRMRLNQYELDVLTASDGTDGFWLAVNSEPDVIVTDLRMPNGDGDYLVECLKGRADTSEIPIITLTGRRDQQLERWMRTLGVEEYLHKPPDFDKLASALGRYIELKPAAETARRSRGGGARNPPAPR